MPNTKSRPAKTGENPSGPAAGNPAGPRSAPFSAEERAAMRERAKEMRQEARRTATAAEGEAAVRAAIAAMPPDDRAIAEVVHRLVRTHTPNLVPRTWYGMPAYSKDDEVVCFFQHAGKFKARYGTLGFTDEAHLDDGNMWPNSFALTKVTPTEEKRIAALLKAAVG